MKTFDVPEFYRSPIIARVKESRKIRDPRKKDFSPTVLDFGAVRFLIPRHFGFCYGVENAIEISYRALEENPGKRIYLLSQMIHNPTVNDDLQQRGMRFIMDTQGNQFVDWDELTADDIVVIPAFGTTVEIMKILEDKGIQIEKYNTTCPFVEKVWKRSSQLGEQDFTVIIHGKIKHEETRATFSHSYQGAPSVVVYNMEEAERLAKYVKGEKFAEDFYAEFEGKYSEGFDPSIHLKRVGVVNQTTMLATETQAIADFFKQTMIDCFGESHFKDHFADTRDTLCYATNDNQRATLGALEEDADLALVVGGYNSSNTSHIAELCEEKMPTFFINSKDEIKSDHEIHHFDYSHKKKLVSKNWLGEKRPLTVILTSGASCPDATVDGVMQEVLSFFSDAREVEEVINETCSA
jgi:4-hydroxy-3-methylbut-2-enyl diphosphate reductase